MIRFVVSSRHCMVRLCDLSRLPRFTSPLHARSAPLVRSQSAGQRTLAQNVLYFPTVFVEAYPSSGDTLERFSVQVQPPFSVPIGTLNVAQDNTEATSDKLTTQPAGQAEPEPGALQRNTGSGNAPTWFLIVLAALILVVILAARRLRR